MKFADINKQFRRFRHAVRAFSSMTRAGLANQNDAMIHGLQAELEKPVFCHPFVQETRRLRRVIHRLEAELAGLRKPKPQMHLNPSDHLPVVGARLWIEVEPGKLVKAIRTGFIPSKKSQMGYELSDGTVLTGRYRWAYQ